MAFISKGNTKLGKIPNVSLPPVVTCNGCENTCSHKCYAQKFYKMWPTVRKAWDTNWAEYQEDSTGFFLSIREQLRKSKPRFFRWHVGGDVPDYNYFSGIVVTAEELPNTKFLLFTKQYDIVNKWVAANGIGALPNNLQLVFSMWPGVEVDNPYGFKCAWMQDGTETRVPESAFECGGSCVDCSACFSLNKIDRDVVFHVH